MQISYSVHSMLVSLIFILSLTICSCRTSAEEPQTNRHKKRNKGLVIDKRFLNTPLSFRGRLRLARLGWQIDNNGGIIAESPILLLIEARNSEAGKDRLDVFWEAPVRNDLTPTVLYNRDTDEEHLTVRADNSGALASIMAGISTDTKQSYLDRLFAYPWLAVCDEMDFSILSNCRWSECKHLVHKVPQVYINGVRDTDDKYSQIVMSFQSEDGRIESRRVSFFLDSNSNDGETDELISAIDLTARNESGEEFDRDSTLELSYRVLDWQRLKQASESSTETQLFPRVIVWERHLNRPRFPNKSRRHRVISIVTIEPLLSVGLMEWNHLLPEMHVADFRFATARVETTAREECLVEKLLSDAEGDVTLLSRLLSIDIKADYAIAMAPISIGNVIPAKSIGAFLDGQAFRCFSDHKVANFYENDKIKGDVDRYPALTESASILKLSSTVFAANHGDGASSKTKLRSGYESVTPDERTTGRVFVFWGICLGMLLLTGGVTLIYRSAKATPPSSY